ncbi:hypothetical protein BJ973_000695 [Actinoplanes tereljensis]|uniref:DUF4132 domain-containing protein n=1 Tax=Paractinoplanes tereljensis TaxID=571912 RepID=A0A919NSW6_9ACTN|nr:DUF4132 domain-containing protein [Actinoplanes tereljensis]GIF22947.1 hypothetical protein Ate02nite_56770 [Actinoplanes tereljensis]
MAKFVLPDEDVWVLPEAWRDGLSPRRGESVSLPADPVGLLRDMLGTEEFAKRVARTARRAVIFDSALVAAGHGHLDGWRGPDGPGADPRHAAVAALLAGTRNGTVATALVDAWVARFGIEFAARAVGEMAGLVVSGALWEIDPAPKENFERMWRGRDLEGLISVARATRVRLAGAPGEEYERAVEILAGYRTSPVGRIVTTYLVPRRTDWVDEDCAATAAGWPDASDHGEAWKQAAGLLLLAAGTVGQVELLRGNVTASPLLYERKGEVGTLLDGVGPAAAVFLDDPFFRRLFSLEDEKPNYRERLNPDGIRLLAAIPTDDAFRLLCRVTLEGPLLRPGLLLKSGALTRFPVRALRILAELEAEGNCPFYTDLLGGHVLGDPRLLAAALPAPVLARVEAILAGGGAGIGTAWAAELDREYPRRIDSADDEKRMIGALAAVPTEEAFGLVLDRVERNYFRPALLVAAKRDPRVALRVLAERAPGGVVDELLRNHVLAYPQAVADTLATLSPAARGRVEAITGISTPADRAADLPEWLVLPLLPAGTLQGVIPLLAASTIAAPHPGIAELRATGDPRALAALAWAIFEQWQAAGYPARSNLAMVALARLGDDSTVPALTALFPSWASAGMRVRTGMDVLAAIGTDLALTHLHRLSRKARTAGFRRLAEQRLADVATARGLRPAQLADRIVPDFGLDADGRAVLDDGPHRFTAGIDAQFQVWITDEHGRHLTRLPRTATAARRYLTELRKDLPAVAAERSRALEDAMALGDRWTAEEFRRYFVEHPLMWQLTHRLLWTAFDERGAAVAVFRAAEDRTFADRDDKTWTLGPTLTVGVAHPWHFAPDRTAWAQILHDYLIIQPFPQVSRELFGLEDLSAVAGTEVPSGKLFALAARGWRFTDGHRSLERTWPGARTIEIRFAPGYHWQDPDQPQHLAEIRGDVAGLTPTGISEVARDVRFLTT